MIVNIVKIFQKNYYEIKMFMSSDNNGAEKNTGYMSRDLTKCNKMFKKKKKKKKNYEGNLVNHRLAKHLFCKISLKSTKTVLFLKNFVKLRQIDEKKVQKKYKA